MSIDTSAIYAEINARFEAALATAIKEGGTAPWQKPWTTGNTAPRNLQSNKAYRGINALLLALSGYDDPRWTTFAAAKKMGGKVRKGEHSTLVTLWKRIKVKDKNDPTQDAIIPILRYFRVFNVAQVDWPEGVLKPLTVEPTPDFDAHEEAERVLMEYIDSDAELSLRWGGNSAHYTPSQHSITLPDREQFKSQHGFYGTVFHECVHATGKGIGRNVSNPFGSEPYAREELCAEMGSAFVCAAVGVDGGFDNNIAYLQNWMRAIQNDDKLIVKSAGMAQRAADRILGISFEEPASPVPDTIPDDEKVAA